MSPRKLFLIVAASSLSCIPPALAQQTEPTQQPAQQQPTQQPKQMPERGQAQQPRAAATVWSADKLMDTDVRTPQGDEIGEIEDLLIDDQGRVASVVVESGGFLGLGSKKVELPFKELQLDRDADGKIRIKSNATAEQLQSAPEYKGSD